MTCSTLVVLSCALAAPQAKDNALEPREVAPGVFVLSFSDKHGSANAGWIALDEHVLLVGAPHAEVVPRLLEEAARTAGKPVREAVVLDVGPHAIEAGRSLAARGVGVLEGPEGVRRLRQAGGGEVEIHPLGPGVGGGSVAVLIKPAGVLFTGAACVHGPRVVLPGSNTGLWLQALRKLRGLGAKVVVPGRGTSGGPEVVERHERFLVELRRQVGHCVAQGWPLEPVRKRVRIEPEWLVWMPYDHPTMEDIDHVYSELTVPKAPFALDPFRADERAARVLVVIGDSPHEPGHLEAAGVAARLAVDPRSISEETLRSVELLVLLRDGYWWPDGPEKPPRQWMTLEQERAIAAFVERGGGFLALHNATGLYPEKGPYLELLGGTYEGHGPLERFRVRVVDRAHSVTRGVEDYEVADEQHTPRPDLSKVHVILESRSAEGVQAAAGWVRQAGRGRVCYLANGHTRDALNEPMFQKLIRNGIAWCLERR